MGLLLLPLLLLQMEMSWEQSIMRQQQHLHNDNLLSVVVATIGDN